MQGDELPNLADQRRFTVLGLIACADGQKIMVGEGAHADDLPAGEDGIQEMADRICKHYGEMYGDPTATWRLLRLWEHGTNNETTGVLEIGDMERLEAELAERS